MKATAIDQSTERKEGFPAARLYQAGAIILKIRTNYKFILLLSTNRIHIVFVKVADPVFCTVGLMLIYKQSPYAGIKSRQSNKAWDIR